MTIGNMAIYPEDQLWLKQQVNQLTFGSILRSWRLCEAWTAEDMAHKLSVTKQMISQWETGRRLPSPKKAVEVAEILGMSPASTLLVLINQQLKQADLPYRVEKLAA